MCATRSKSTCLAVLLVLVPLLLLAACAAEQPAGTPTVQALGTSAITPISTPPLPALEILNRSEQAYYVSLPLSKVSSAVLTLTANSGSDTAKAQTTKYVTFYQAPDKWRAEYGEGVMIRDRNGSYDINGGASMGSSFLMLLFGTEFVGMGECYKMGRAVVAGTGKMSGQQAWVVRVPPTEECRQQQGLGDALIWVDQRTYIDLRVQIEATKEGVVEAGELYTTQVEYDVPLNPVLFTKPTPTPTSVPTPLPTAATIPLAGLTAQKILQRSNDVFDNNAIGHSNSTEHPDVPLLVDAIAFLALTETIQSRAEGLAANQQAALTSGTHSFYYRAPSQWRSEYNTGELIIANGNEVSYRERDGAVTRAFIYSDDNDFFSRFAAQDMAYFFAAPRNCYTDPALVGSDQVAGRAAWVIEVTANGDSCTSNGGRKYYSSKLWVDQQTYLALKLEERQQDGSLYRSRTVNSVEYNVVPTDGNLFNVVEPSPTVTPTPLPGAATSTPPDRSPIQLLYQAGSFFRWDTNTKRPANPNISTLVMTMTTKTTRSPYMPARQGEVRHKVWYQAPSYWRTETEAEGQRTIELNNSARQGEPNPYSASDLASYLTLASDSACYKPLVVSSETTVLGRQTWVLETTSNKQCQLRDFYHPADKITLWIDQATLITLKTEWRNDDGNMVFQGEVEGIELNVPLDSSIFTTK